MPLYEVAGVAINIANDDSESFMYMRDFLLPQQRQQSKADLTFVFQSNEVIEVPQGNIISEENISFKWLKKTSGETGYYIYVQEFGIGKIMVLMDIENSWRKVVFTWCNYIGNDPQVMVNSQSQIRLATHIMMGIVFRYNLLHMDGLVVHASALEWNGKGLIFSAPSGTGKSTHVKLWQEYINDVIVLNDDNPAVRIINNQPTIFGTPWSGSAFIHSNESAPLFAIIVLEQAQDNVLRKLDRHEVILKLMPRVFLPYFDQNFMDKAMTIFENIITSVPVYLLKCRPDREAVELVYQCLK
ncbi:hypothetical protein [Desulfosporosinus sp. OT]|uniref:hypothetical protein n=1 Tax=Desulfosporosinus sp. OT TaxID=913865 RepID=UPI000223A79E|nr:hypothetical protein [Desulfosporosinus sp. OT]EGW38456.1 hypothetical protein DOT_3740 [Desulfosporosinus sp. OT]